MKHLVTFFIFFIPFISTAQFKAVSINLFDSQGNLMDGCIIAFNGNLWKDAVDLDDVRKINNPLANIGIIYGFDTLAGEKRTTYAAVPISMWNLTEQVYTLKIFTVGINTAFLQDGSKYIHIADTLKYQFSGNTAGINRFKIYLCSVLSIPEFATPIALNQPKKDYLIYNVLGQIIYKGKKKPVGAFKKVSEEIYVKIQ